MRLKKTACALLGGAAFLAAAPVLADPPRWAQARDYRHHPGRYPYVVHRVYYYPPPPVVVVPRPVYVERPVYIERPVIVQPAPVYYSPSTYYAPPAYVAAPGVATVGGAIAGAAIGSQIGGGNGRTAAIALGTVLGDLWDNSVEVRR